MHVSESLTNAFGPVFRTRSPEHVICGGPYEAAKCAVVAPFDAVAAVATAQEIAATATVTSRRSTFRITTLPQSDRVILGP
jgi:hypothetical protein